jgi:hypothetical protein
MSEISRIEDAAEKRAERRRVVTMSNMQATMHSVTIDLERIKGLGDSERAAALAGVAHRLELLKRAALGLRVESLELAELAAIEFVSIEEPAAAER